MAENGEEISFVSGSEPVFEFFCEFCNEEGLHKEAEGHCSNCDEYLCGSCMSIHKRTRAYRYHEILDKDNMPRNTPPSTDHVRNDISTMCKQHKGEPVKYYCKSHDELTCSKCFVKCHKACTDIIDITETTNSVFDDQEYKDFIQKLKFLETQVHKITTRSREQSIKSERCCSEAIESVMRFRTEINTVLDDIESSLKTQAEDMKSKDVTKLETLKHSCTKVQETIERISSEFVSLKSENRVCQAYIKMKETREDIEKIEMKLAEADGNNSITTYTFVPNTELTEFLRRPGVLGLLSIENKVEKIKRNPTSTTMDNKVENKQQSPTSVTTDKKEGKTERSPSSVTTDNTEEKTKQSPASVTMDNNVDKKVQSPTSEIMDNKEEKTERSPSSVTMDTNVEKKVQRSTSEIMDNKEEKTERSPSSVTMDTNVDKKVQSPTSEIKTVSSASYVQDINVRSTSDGETCWITGSAVLSSSKLVVVDHANEKVKLVDTRSMEIISELQVYGWLWDVTLIKEDQVAVTNYKNHTILILKVTDTITKERQIKVNGQCRGIVFSKNQLVVIYVNPSYIGIMDVYGNVDSKIESDKDGSKLFIYAHYVCASGDGDTLYVSDYGAHKVVSMSRDGSVKAVYTDSYLRLPEKICVVHRGNVFVCGFSSQNIHMLTPDCTKIKVILDQTDGLTNSVYSVSHCRQTDKLYVGMRNNDKVKVYQLS